MLPKARMVAALEHREPDRVPIGEVAADGPIIEAALGHSTLCNGKWKMRQALWAGHRDQVVDEYCRDLVAFARHFDWDYVVAVNGPSSRVDHRPTEMLGPTTWRDADGRVWHSSPESGVDGMLLEAPEMTIDDIVIPPDPTPIDETTLEPLERVVKELGGTHFVIGRVPDGTFPWHETIGMEPYLTRMITEPEFIRKLVAWKLKETVAYIEAAAAMGVDAILIGTDYCDNRGLIMGPGLYRELVYPALQVQVETAHRAGKYFVKHTDGYLWPILDSFVEAGVDAWQGIQPRIGMDLKLLKEKYAGKLALFGGVDCDTLIAGGPADVEAQVRYAIKHAAPGGGFAMTSGNSLLPGVKLENYTALVEATRRLGTYPISL
jgi:hypothetical protein